jgi:hypothetical protein
MYSVCICALVLTSSPRKVLSVSCLCWDSTLLDEPTWSGVMGCVGVCPSLCLAVSLSRCVFVCVGALCLWLTAFCMCACTCTGMWGSRVSWASPSPWMLCDGRCSAPGSRHGLQSPTDSVTSPFCLCVYSSPFRHVNLLVYSGTLACAR